MGYYKDVACIQTDLRRVVIVDNSPMSFARHVENGIPIESWTEDLGDTKLLELLVVLDGLRYVEDVRNILSLKS